MIAAAVPRPEPEECGLCRTSFTPGSGQYARVPDSSYIDPADPAHDGNRPVTACGPDHLSQLTAILRGRPFTYAELWAGRLAQVHAAHPGGIGLKELARRSGLTEAQLEEAALWAGRGSMPRP
ncbi:hypothetical protein ACIGFK_16910 [Streptomyces sp. NPDC085524]|uniref:hypothetical protein n=1 Tax=unclassified Streptomyces TaxID=2593676 RepID=UPI0035D596EE